MKRGIFILLVILLCFQVSSLDLDLKDHNPGETLIIKIPKTVQNLKSSQFHFYSGRVYVPMVSDLGRINNDYYFYAILPNKERNYTLVIENAEYLNKRQDFKFNFSVKGEPTFYINPGFIITNKDFDVIIKSYTVEKVISEFNSIKEIDLIPGLKKTLKYKIRDTNTSFNFLKISSNNTKYEIPVRSFKEETELAKIRFSISNHTVYVPENQDFQHSLSLINLGQEKENITLTFPELEEINITNKEFLLNPGESKEIPVIINSDKKLNFKLKASSGKVFSNTTINIYPKKVDEIENTTNKITEEKTCQELNGGICKKEEECQGISKLTQDGLCCLGECKEESKTGRTIILVVILLILLILFFFIFKKLKTKKIPVEERLKKNSEDYEKRFKSKETKNKLSRN
jgi:hypothetical protein